MHRRSQLALAILLLGLAVAATGQSTERSTDLVIEAREDRCPDGRAYCLALIGGDPSLIEPGAELTLHFLNPTGSQSTHNLHLTRPGDADPARQNTAPNASIAATPDLAPGENATLTVTVPESGALYAWCDLTGHERLGMWTVLDEHTPVERGPADTPAAGVLAGLGALLLAANATRVMKIGERD